MWVTTPWSFAINSLSALRGSFSTTENSERSSLASISGASSYENVTQPLSQGPQA